MSAAHFKHQHVIWLFHPKCLYSPPPKKKKIKYLQIKIRNQVLLVWQANINADPNLNLRVLLFYFPNGKFDALVYCFDGCCFWRNLVVIFLGDFFFCYCIMFLTVRVWIWFILHYRWEQYTGKQSSRARLTYVSVKQHLVCSVDCIQYL